MEAFNVQFNSGIVIQSARLHQAVKPIASYQYSMHAWHACHHCMSSLCTSCHSGTRPQPLFVSPTRDYCRCGCTSVH